MSIDKIKKYVFDRLNNELSDKLTYHGVHHTRSVLKACEEYIKRMNLSEKDAFLLKTAALFHDIGFTQTYDNHEEEGIRMAREILPGWNYSQEDIETIAGIIRATKIPQKPTTIPEQIIGDSDLDYLGTDEFDSIGDTLFEELLSFNKISDRKQWDMLQINFLQNHSYHTPYAKKYREPLKQKHLKEILNRLNN